MPTQLELVALDRASVRSVDQDGHLHVSRTPISKANVCGYLGREIPDWHGLGLEPGRIYNLYRDAAELEKAAPTFNGKPLLFGHKPVSADDHDHDKTVGGVTNPEWVNPYLYAALDVWAGPAIKEIQSGRHEQLSSAYRYRAVMEPGTAPDGTKYDGRMVDISANHVALVPEGRAGPDVVVLDAALAHPRKLIEVLMPGKAVLSRTASMASGALLMYARSRLAQDAKIDVVPLLKGINKDNIKAKAPVIAKAFDAALRPKLATDADLDQNDVQSIVEQVGEIVAASSEEIADVVDTPADPVVDEMDDDALRAALKAKGYSDEEVDAILAKSMKSAADAEKDANAKAAQASDAAVRAATKDMVTKGAMDAAIAAAVKLAQDSAREAQASLREAEAHVTPVVGKLAMACDSAEAVFRGALKALNVVEADTLPEAALRPVFDAHAAAKRTVEAPRAPAALASDASFTGKSITEMFPQLSRLHG